MMFFVLANIVVFAKIGPVILEKKIFKYFHYYLPLKKKKKKKKKMWKVYDNDSDGDNEGQRTKCDQKSSLESSAQIS